MLVNTIFTTAPIDSFVRVEDVTNPARRLPTISDVTCDITSPCGALPVIQSATSWSDPVQRLHADPPLDVIAIDNLPSMLPVESSIAFSVALSPLLAQLAEFGPMLPVSSVMTAPAPAAHSIDRVRSAGKRGFSDTTVAPG